MGENIFENSVQYLAFGQCIILFGFGQEFSFWCIPTLNNIKKLEDLMKKNDAFERQHRTYTASYLWVFINGKFVW